MTKRNKHIRNLPIYALDMRYWLATEYNKHLYFFGAYDSREQALDVASRLGLKITENCLCKTNQ